jgi:ketosteroid isomerase-like protein
MRIASLTLVVVMFVGYTAAAQNMDPTLVKRSAEWDAAMDAKDAAKLASFYTEDALAFSEGAPPTKGRAAAQKMFEAMLKMNPPRMSTKILEATSSGDIGYIVGTYSIPAGAPDKKVRTGHYLQIWKRVGGQWLIAYATFSDGPSQ